MIASFSHTPNITGIRAMEFTNFLGDTGKMGSFPAVSKVTLTAEQGSAAGGTYGI